MFEERPKQWIRALIQTRRLIEIVIWRFLDRKHRLSLCC
ncbi:hypothetical protein H1P_4860004 [Hyella patelloides LEGE 07179]|uniref:Uncharacterized protein n=1 Tax=Hyella patelloides LEGE 07179 TaxID=945734 RepID=A0A563VZ26_9CYAN|nr:hypothetical protein H1P_4860004 [Hyella patelloides LEGE 07179]